MHWVARAPEAVTALSGGSYLAVIIDLNASPQRTLDALACVRAAAPITPLLLITKELSRVVLNAAQRQRCQVLAQPAEQAQIDAFIERAQATQRLTREQLRAGLVKLCRDHALDLHSCDFLARTVGMDEVCRSAPEPLAPEEAHRQLRALLLKLNLRTVSGLEAQLLRCAVLVRTGRETMLDSNESPAVQSA